MTRAELERVLDWANDKLATGAEPPWAWYQYMKLRETLEAGTNRLWELGAIGVVEEAATGGAALRAFFPPGTSPAALTADLRDYLDDLAALEVPGAVAKIVNRAMRSDPADRYQSAEAMMMDIEKVLRLGA